MTTYSVGSNAQYTVLDMVSGPQALLSCHKELNTFSQTAPLIGITFSVIILRVSLGISSREITDISQPYSTGRSSGSNTLALARRGVAVNVSVEVDGDDTNMPKRQSKVYV